MPCKIQQLGVCCLWPIKTTMASGLVPWAPWAPWAPPNQNSDFVAFLYRNSDLPSRESYAKMTRSRNCSAGGRHLGAVAASQSILQPIQPSRAIRPARANLEAISTKAPISAATIAPTNDFDASPSPQARHMFGPRLVPMEKLPQVALNHKRILSGFRARTVNLLAHQPATVDPPAICRLLANRTTPLA